MKINGVELPDIDVADAVEMERYEAALDKVNAEMKNLDIQGKRRSELIRIQCTVVFEFFNSIFGNGTDRKVFGNSVNLTTCLTAFEEVAKSIDTMDSNLGKAYRAKYSPNREQKRHPNGGKKKHNNYNRPKLVQQNANSAK